MISEKKSDNSGRHLVVFVHGFQGQSHDMRLLRNTLLLLYPSAITYCSKTNETNTEAPIQEMGQKLAEELFEYFSLYCP